SNHDWNPMTEPDQLDDRIIRIAKVAKAVNTPIRGKTMEQSNVTVKTGETLYQQYCFSCHKAKGEGLADIYPALAGSDVVQDKKKLFETVLNGVSGGTYELPAFDFLTNEELSLILNYVRISLDNQQDSVVFSEEDRKALPPKVQ